MGIHPALLGAAVAIVAALPIAKAGAVDSMRNPGAHATAYCQPALPAFDGLIRKRPQAVQNEGTADAFVTCSVPIDIGASALNGVAMIFVNNTGGEVSIPCTLSNGAVGEVIFIPKVTTGSEPFITNTWTPADNDDEPLEPMMSFSCKLPPATGVHFIYTAYAVDVGA